MDELLVIEDGHEYEEFARLFLAKDFEVRGVHSAREALEAIATTPAEALLVDLRFERSPLEDLVGDLEATTKRLGGDRGRAVRWLKEQQGTLVLGALREAGCHSPAVFVHDFPPRRLKNLRRLYGDVHAVPSFDAARIRSALLGEAS